MNPSSVYLLGYCIFSIGLVAFMIRWVLPEAPPPMKIAIIVTSPLLVPWFALQAIGCVFKSLMYAQTLQAHRQFFSDYEYLLLAEGELEDELGALFEGYTTDLGNQGFAHTGDYLMRTEPYRLLSRVFWNEAGTERATITSCLGNVGVELSTILSDGTNVVTTSFDTSSLRPEAEDLLILGNGNTDSMADLLERHRHATFQAQLDGERQALAFDSSESVACIRYNHRLFYHWRHRLGDSSPPPPAELPKSCGSVNLTFA